MSLQYPKPNHNHAAEYQVAGIPFVTSSVYNEIQTAGSEATQVSFPYVTQWIMVQSTGMGGLKVGFTELGTIGPTATRPDVRRNFFIVASGSMANGDRAGISDTPAMPLLHVRCKEIWIAGLPTNDPAAGAGFAVVAGLTNCKSDAFPILTGSDGFVGVG